MKRAFVLRWMLVVAVLTPLGLVTYRCYNPPLPDHAEAARIVEGFDGELLAYEVIHNVPHVVYVGRLDRVTFDHLKRDRISIEWPPTPRWQLTGRDQVALVPRGLYSATRVPCGAVEPRFCGPGFDLFGIVDSPEVVSLEVVCAETRLDFPVSVPAFVIRVDASCATPIEYRWLDATGEAAWVQPAD
ncbi:MAG: hypothetical protein R3C39_08790 [Dehalococcoidia bacterium]